MLQLVMWPFGQSSAVGSASPSVTEHTASHFSLLGAKLSDGNDKAQAGSHFWNTLAKAARFANRY